MTTHATNQDVSDFDTSTLTCSHASDRTTFFNAEANEQGKRSGYLVEYAPTEQIFNDLQQEVTKEYVSGRFG